MNASTAAACGKVTDIAQVAAVAVVITAAILPDCYNDDPLATMASPHWNDVPQAKASPSTSTTAALATANIPSMTATSAQDEPVRIPSYSIIQPIH